MIDEDSQTIKVKVVSHEEIEDRVKKYLLYMKGEGNLEEPIHEPLIILPGEYSQFIESHGKMSEGGDNVTEKGCWNCNYNDLDVRLEPCNSCLGFSNWKVS